jgi:hypothetical protein
MIVKVTRDSSQRKLNLEKRDKNEKTPLMLARSHKHNEIVKLLQTEIKKRNRYNSVQPIIETWWIHFHRLKFPWFKVQIILFEFHRNTVCRGFGKGNAKGPLIFFVGTVLLWCYPMYFLRVSIYGKCTIILLRNLIYNFPNTAVHSVNVELAERCSLLLLLLEYSDVAFVVGFFQTRPRIPANEYGKLRANHSEGKIVFTLIIFVRKYSCKHCDLTDSFRLQS